MKGVKHYTRNEIVSMINERDKETKHKIANLRSNFAEWLYRNSEPIPNDEGKPDPAHSG